MVSMDDVLARANTIYACRKRRCTEEDLAYVAPEAMPRIVSNQVMAMMEAILEAFNDDKARSAEEVAAAEYWERMHADDHAL